MQSRPTVAVLSAARTDIDTAVLHATAFGSHGHRQYEPRNCAMRTRLLTFGGGCADPRVTA